MASATSRGPRGSGEAFRTYIIQSATASPFTREPSLWLRTLMSSYNPYEQLCRLDRSSSRFHDEVSNILYGGEYKQSVPNLQDNDLVRLIDYLDEVRRRVLLLHTLLNLLEILNVLDPSSSTFWKCLHELRHLCGSRTILPTSHIILSPLLITSSHPVTSGSFGDVYEGTLDGSKVCAKRVRVYPEDGPAGARRVCCPIVFPIYQC